MKQTLLTFLIAAMAISAFAQDIIITKDEKKIDAKLLEISDTEIRYKEADDLEGPTYVLDTKKIVSIVLSSGKVKVFDNSKEEEDLPVKQEPQPEVKKAEPVQPIAPAPKPEPKPEPEQEPQPEKIVDDPETEYLAQDVLNYLNGIPKNVVFVEGDYAMLYNKEAIVYVQINYDKSAIVEYSHDDKTINNRNGSLAEYIKIDPAFAEFDLSQLEKTACDKYNTVLRPRKCTMMPFSEFKEDGRKPQYLLSFNIEKIDTGNGAESIETVNGGNKAGGAVLCGKITISNLADLADQPNASPTDQQNVCTLYVDRVKGKGSVHLQARILNAIEDLFAKQLFFIKPAK